jgi:formylglycine-generating enzyme required for sulfatase activity
VTYVSWGDAARFANWFHNGQPTGVEGSATTETGAYTLNGATSNAALNAITRNAGAKWFIPSESEWYKAAYYDPAASHYWNHATGTNTTPISTPPGSAPNTANYHGVSNYAVTGSPNYSPNQNYLTDVGAYTTSPSPYGTFDQAGLVLQWNEALISGSGRGLRGGSWASVFVSLAATSRGSGDPADGSGLIGFRVATTVPEPSAAVLAIFACSLSWIRRRRIPH